MTTKQTNNDFKEKHNNLTEKILEILSKVIDERKKYYYKNDSIKPNQGLIRETIDKYVNYNTGIAGAAGLVPGPLGILTAIPEIVLILKHQLMMIYDIAFHSGNKDAISEELLLIIFLEVNQLQKDIILKSYDELRIKKIAQGDMKRIVGVLSLKILQRIGRSLICRWLPVLGAAALAIWTRYTTSLIGKRTREILKKKIVYGGQAVDKLPKEIDSYADADESALDEDFIFPVENFLLEIKNPVTGIIKVETKDLTELKILAMMNLMNIDKHMDEREINYIEKILEICNLSDEKKTALKEKIQSGEEYHINYVLFKDSKEDALGLMVDLVTLAKRDEKINDNEIKYIEKVAKIVGIDMALLEDMLN